MNLVDVIILLSEVFPSIFVLGQISYSKWNKINLTVSDMLTGIFLGLVPVLNVFIFVLGVSHAFAELIHSKKVHNFLGKEIIIGKKNP